MTNKTITLSRELAERLNSDHSYVRNRARLELSAALAEPVPPAVGNPEVLGYSVKGNRYAIRLTKGELLELSENYTGSVLVELVDRAHVTRLQAEVSHLRQHKNDYMEAAEETRKALQAEVERLKQGSQVLIGDLERRDATVERLQSELTSANADKAAYGQNAIDLRLQLDVSQDALTKARECLKAVRKTLGSDFWDKWAALEEVRDNIDDILANHSAPADKGHTPKEANGFWQWLDSAYRDGSKGEEPRFTKYNMEVAYTAGYTACLNQTKQ